VNFRGSGYERVHSFDRTTQILAARDDLTTCIRNSGINVKDSSLKSLRQLIPKPFFKAPSSGTRSQPLDAGA